MSYEFRAPLDEISPSPTNPRTRFDEAALAELAETIKDIGVMQPILVRTHPKFPTVDTPLELIAGERRWRASKLAGLHDIPVILRDDLDDAAIVKLQMIENLQREGLDPLDEAQGYRRMIDDYGYTAEALGKEINKSRSYIFSQLKLLDLCEDGQRLLRGGAISASVALYVARIPTTELQLKAIKDVTEVSWQGEKMSARHAARHIQNRYMTRLKAAPFPLDVEGVAGMGTCAGCPKRTGNAPELYPDVDDPDICTDPDCFALKRAAEAERQAANLGSEVQILTGQDAHQAMPACYTETRTHARLDAVCTNDPQRRTYREIMGEDTEGVSLVEHGEKFVPVVQKKVITEKLRKEGLVTESQKQRAEQKKEKQKLEIANAWRDRVFRETRDRAASEVSSARPLDNLLEIAMPVIAHTFMVLAGYDKGGQVAGLWGAIGMDNYTRQQAYLLQLPTMKWEELLLVCLDLALIGERQTDNYHAQPQLLLTIAGALEIDTDAQLEAIKAEFAEADAKKQAKSAKKSPGASTSESTSTPPTAALATTNTEGEDAPAAAAAGDREEPHEQSPAGAGEGVEKPNGAPAVFAVGDRVRIVKGTIDDQLIVHIGKIGTVDLIQQSLLNGRPCMAVELDDGERVTVYENEIEMYEEQIETRGEFSVGSRVRIKVKDSDVDLSGKTGTVIAIGKYPSGAYFYGVEIDDDDGDQLDFFGFEIEMYEEPTDAEPLSADDTAPEKQFKPGDRVVVIDSAALNDQAGTVVRMDPTGTLYPCVVDIDGIEYNFFPKQLDLVETDEKPTAAEPITFRPGDRIEVKPDAKGPGGKRRKCAGKQGVVELLIACSATPGGEIYVVKIDDANETTNIRGDEMLLIDRPAPAKAKRPPNPYQHPDDAELQWSGRGRKPKWVENWIADGGALDDLKRTEEVAA